MKVKVAAKAGFCFGVKRAVEMARQCLHDRDGPVYTLGPLIHNDQVTGALANEGIISVNDLDEIPGPGTVIIRSHGVVPEIYDRAEQRGLELVDATCPFVRKVQQTVHDLVKQNIPVVVVGDPNHPEVQGIIGWSGGRAMVVANEGQAEKLDQYPELGVVAQTTQRQDNFDAVINVLSKCGSRVQVYNTICLATAERQREALKLAQQVDAVLVLGGKKSANTAKLAQICLTAGKPVYMVETADEIDLAFLKGLRTMGVTAGASTPGWIIEEVCRRMMDFEETNNQEVMEAQAEEQPAVEAEPQEDMKQEMEDAVEVRYLKNGDIVTGVVVQINQDEVLVDVGAKSEGVVPIRELSNFSVDSPQDVVKVGDEIKVYVLKAEDKEGRVILSKEKADAEEAWARLEEDMNEGQVVTGFVREVVKGGILVDVGVRAFLPASLVDRGYVEDLSKYLNMEVSAKVIELNRARRKVILSRKAVLEDDFARNREEMLNNLEEGQVIKGVVRRLTNFGAFVDIGGVDGLLHISEMAWYRINHPSEVVQVGDELDVKVLRVDLDNEKVSLGLKQVLANPWDNIEGNYPVGSVINAKVVRLAPFGAFVQLEPGVEGLVHISHLADRHVATPDEVVQEGEEIRVKVLSVDSDEKRIRLSIREVDREKPSKPAPREYQPKKQEIQMPNNDSGNVTIGDLVGDIFGKRDRE